MTLVEITLAIFILVLAIIPIYQHATRDATTNIETEKIQMADKLLQSIKEEMTSIPFAEFSKRTKDLPNPDGPFELTDAYYPVSLDRVLSLQRKFKNFEVIGSWTFLIRDGKVDKSMVQVDVMVSWDQPQKKWERNRTFLIIRP